MMVTENDVRTRAYFHFKNRTGKSWDNPDANWKQAEAEEAVWSAAKALDIGDELRTFRPLSQFIPALIVPSINQKVANGVINSTALPVEIKGLQILFPPSGAPVVQVNDEVKVSVDVTLLPGREIRPSDPIRFPDTAPESEWRLAPPTINGSSVGYYLFFSSFMDMRVIFNFMPAVPGDGVRAPDMRQMLQELYARHDFIQANPPEQLLARLKQLGWPPSPVYYPSLAQTMAQPGGDAPDIIASTIIALLGPDYWSRRIALLAELRVFEDRMTYVRKAIEEYLEGDYVAAIYVAVPQFEGIIKDYVTSSGGTLKKYFRETLGEFRRLIESRAVLLFPRFVLTLIVEFIDSGSFWNDTRTITNPRQEVNRHGIVHGVFTGFETQELALKLLILIDCVAFVLLQDQLIRGVLR